MANSMAEKKEVVQWIEKNAGAPTPSAAFFKDERGWKVSEDQVREWWKQRTAIKAAPALCSRLSGAGAKPRLSEIEDILFDQVLFCRSAKEKVCRDWIRDAGFFASDRWVNGFTRRYGMSLRRTTNLAVLTDDVLTDRAVSFLSYLASRMDGLSDDHIILIDETAVYFENPRPPDDGPSWSSSRCAKVYGICFNAGDDCAGRHGDRPQAAPAGCLERGQAG
ncbi:hypothetical protein PF005_g8690 [Phytophthora fragariae]|nr:hypothetical protein PF005_g8690 [Phytophthora fragariae]